MRYIINSYYLMIGYRDHPYCLSNLYSGDTFFFDSKEYEMIQRCNGTDDIDPQSFEPKEKELFDRLLQNYLIRPSNDNKTLSDYQKYKLYPNNYKNDVQLSITGHCNCRCRHCFVSAPHAKYDELSFNDCVHILDELAGCGVRKIGLTGGEPLIHPGFKQIIEEISKRRLILSTLYTNGLILSDEILQLLKTYNQSPDIQISFDGLGTHEWLRGIKGIQNTVIDSIRRSVKHGFFTHISMVLYKDNLNSILENIRFLDSLGVKSIKISPIENLGEWQAYAKDHGISHEQAYEEYLRIIPELLQNKPQARIELGGFFIYDPSKDLITSSYEKRCSSRNQDHYYLCKSLKQSFYINSNGILYPCATMMNDENNNQFNILKRPLEEIFDDEQFNFIAGKTAADYFNENKKCSECEYKYLCAGGCRAKALLDGNSLMGIDEQTCAYFKDGWKEKKDKLLLSLLGDHD